MKPDALEASLDAGLCQRTFASGGTGPTDVAAFFLGQTAPHTRVLVGAQCELQALRPAHARQAHGLGGCDLINSWARCANREEKLRVGVLAGSSAAPVGYRICEWKNLISHFCLHTTQPGEIQGGPVTTLSGEHLFSSQARFGSSGTRDVTGDDNVSQGVRVENVACVANVEIEI